jgi:hypothetical protein
MHSALPTVSLTCSGIPEISYHIRFLINPQTLTR